MGNTKFKFTFITVLGTFLEWAEYCIYGYLAPKISELFFPQFESGVALLATFGIFAAGFFARPIGAVIFGHIGDRYGRKKALSFSMAIMGAVTLAIGFLPTYAEIGVTASLLLLVCRIVQGLSVSGEFNGAAIFLIEHAPLREKNLAGSWVAAAAASGMLLAAMMVGMITTQSEIVWIWRVPFWLGAVSCLSGFYLRRNLSETPEFNALDKDQKQSESLPLMAALKYSKFPMIQTGAVAAFIGISVYICNIYFSAFLQHKVGFAATTSLMIVAFGQACVAVLIPFMGKLADLWNGRTLMLLGFVGTAIAAPLVFLLGMMHSLFLALCAQSIYAVFNAMTSATAFQHVNGLFPPERRYTGITVAWSLSVAIFAGTAPMMAEYWVDSLHFSQGPALYVSLSAMVAFFLNLRFSVLPKASSHLEMSVNN